MKIANSSISMSSTHQSLSVKQSSLIVGLHVKADSLSNSSGVNSEDNSSNAKLSSETNPALADGTTQEKDEQTQEKQPSALIELSDQGKDKSRMYTIKVPSKMQEEKEKVDSDKTMSTLRALLHYLKSISKNPKAFERLEKFLDEQTSIAVGQNQKTEGQQNGSVIGMAFAASAAQNNNNKMVVVNRRETFEAESEYTSFQAQGIAKTEDGRELSFNVDFSMSRDFMHYSQVDEQLKIQQKSPLICDPLVINVGSDVTKVSDQKFTFDLNADGKEDSISLLGEGSGFLALDKNGDGKINDGSELFGTQSGNGFADLAKYDEDHNGWIDENDSVFQNLRIWFKNDDGEDKLVDLKSADVGAIYLGNASTEFSLKNHDTNELNGIVRSTGLFMRESGAGVGTVQHVDLAL